ncbi:hypothetical protein F4776DRAFT_662367 [Hypoxylon sp. NC0597]|nr:hypothetical protein F4776DRAFT_662367 [Hypoxylon sp. NC0597]
MRLRRLRARELLATGRYRLAEDYSDWLRYWVNGNSTHNSQAGDGSVVADRLQSMQGLLESFDTYSFDILNMVAEFDKVVVEAMATGRGPRDLVYVNNITMAFVLD